MDFHLPRAVRLLPLCSISLSYAVTCLCSDPCCAVLGPSVMWLCNPINRGSWQATVHGDSPGKNAGVGCHALLQGIFPTQGSNPGLPHYRRILDHLSHQEGPRILEWVVYPFSRGSFWPRNPTGVSCIAGRFFTSWAAREALQWPLVR